MIKKFLAGACTQVLLISMLQPLQAATPAAPGTGEVAEYRIGPGDTLEIFVWRNPELSTKVPVRPDGKISAPLVGDVEAVGKTPARLAADIEGILGEYIKTPKVNVIVASAVSANSQIRVVGEAAHPQALPYRNGMTLLDVMIAVGGLGQYAAGNRAHLIRRVDGKSVDMRVRVDDLINRGDLSANVVIQPGDVLSIPQSRF